MANELMDVYGPLDWDGVQAHWWFWRSGGRHGWISHYCLHVDNCSGLEILVFSSLRTSGFFLLGQQW